MMYSPHFAAWQIYLIEGEYSYFKGWAINEFTLVDKLEKHESRFSKYNKSKWNSL